MSSLRTTTCDPLIVPSGNDALFLTYGTISIFHVIMVLMGKSISRASYSIGRTQYILRIFLGHVLNFELHALTEEDIFEVYK